MASSLKDKVSTISELRQTLNARMKISRKKANCTEREHILFSSIPPPGWPDSQTYTRLCKENAKYNAQTAQIPRKCAICFAIYDPAGIQGDDAMDGPVSLSPGNDMAHYVHRRHLSTNSTRSESERLVDPSDFVQVRRDSKFLEHLAGTTYMLDDTSDIYQRPDFAKLQPADHGIDRRRRRSALSVGSDTDAILTGIRFPHADRSQLAPQIGHEQYHLNGIRMDFD